MASPRPSDSSLFLLEPQCVFVPLTSSPPSSGMRTRAEVTGPSRTGGTPTRGATAPSGVTLLDGAPPGLVFTRRPSADTRPLEAQLLHVKIEDLDASGLDFTARPAPPNRSSPRPWLLVPPSHTGSRPPWAEIVASMLPREQAATVAMRDRLVDLVGSSIALGTPAMTAVHQTLQQAGMSDAALQRAYERRYDPLVDLALPGPLELLEAYNARRL